MIPLVPLTLILAAGHVKRRMFVLMCLLFVSSSFYLSKSHLDPNSLSHYGIIVKNYYAREMNVERTKFMIRKSDSIQAPHIVVAGPDIPTIRYFRGKKDGRFVENLTEKEFRKYRSEGYDIYYLPGMRAINIEVHQFDLKAAGANKLTGS
jgi:hypothetical protein